MNSVDLTSDQPLKFRKVEALGVVNIQFLHELVEIFTLVVDLPVYENCLNFVSGEALVTIRVELIE